MPSHQRHTAGPSGRQRRASSKEPRQRGSDEGNGSVTTQGSLRKVRGDGHCLFESWQVGQQAISVVLQPPIVARYRRDSRGSNLLEAAATVRAACGRRVRVWAHQIEIDRSLLVQRSGWLGAQGTVEKHGRRSRRARETHSARVLQLTRRHPGSNPILCDLPCCCWVSKGSTHTQAINVALGT